MQASELSVLVWECPSAPASMRFLAGVIAPGSTCLSGGETFMARTLEAAKLAALSSERANIERRKVARAADLAAKARANLPKARPQSAITDQGYAYLFRALLIERRTCASLGEEFARSGSRVQSVFMKLHRRLKHPARFRLLRRQIPDFTACEAFLKARDLEQMRAAFSAIEPRAQALVLDTIDRMNADAAALESASGPLA
ncbi:hypothetical protein [Methylobacterium gnaphalii]|nr:hypothetical protein [Methylobacterium gnaphalii]GLS49593.1 hypothetical protein GCM10007885_24420 [Methylobacterium gnaphalii]